MTSDRAKAYGRVIKALAGKSSSKLDQLERDRIREAADIHFFAEALDDEVELAATDIRVLAEFLIEADRWEEWQAQRLLENVSACGPSSVPATA